MISPPQSTQNKILLGISGGLLSSVVAALLKHQGYQVLGIHFKTDPAAHEEAERISKKLAIQLITEDVTDLVHEHVVDHVVHSVLANRKPEPTVRGHQKILLERLRAKARDLHCLKVATGHAARAALDPSTGLTRLLRGSDPEHDQSHLLFGLSTDDLKLFVLPIGDLGLQALERLATELELDSSKLKSPPPGFCVIPEERFLPLAEERIPASLKIPGQIKSSDGSVIGDHDGLYKYVRGQSKGLSLHQREKIAGWVVVGLNSSTNTLILGPENLLLVQEITAADVNWLQPVDPVRGLECEARLGQGLYARCRVTQFQHRYVHVEFAQPQKNISPGQSIVFYAGDEVLGGAFVT